MLFPACLAVMSAGIYLWRMMRVWPPGKEGWLEAGLCMMVLHLFCLAALLPVIVWSVARVWRTAKVGELLAATVVLPEIALERTERIRPNEASDSSRSDYEIPNR